MKTNVRVWRLQNTTGFETHPSWDGCRRVRPDRPADPEGWSGYWWAWPLDPDGRVEDRDVLIRAEDVRAAQAGAEVETYVPGLFGCPRPDALADYVRRYVGGADEGQWVALYEGRPIEYVHDEGAVVFEPCRLLRVWPAPEWIRLADAGEFDDFDD